MQGSALGLVALQRGLGCHDPALPSLPTVIPEMPSTRGVPVHLPSLRDHPEELRCCCSPPSSSSSSPPFPARGSRAGSVCMSPFLPAQGAAPGIDSPSPGGAGGSRGDRGLSPVPHPCSIPCVSDALSSQLLLLPPDVSPSSWELWGAALPPPKNPSSCSWLSWSGVCWWGQHSKPWE